MREVKQGETFFGGKKLIDGWMNIENGVMKPESHLPSLSS